MATPNSNDLFLINKDVNGDGSVYETYHVKYGDMLGPVTGPEGVQGPTGPTGPQGIPGADGASVKILGVYADWSAFASSPVFGSSSEGDMYVITNGEAGPSGGNIVPGETNVASVYNIGTGNWERVGPITGPDGATGATGGGYSNVIQGPGPDDISLVPDADNKDPNNKVITNVRGATGPYYDSVESVYYTINKPDPDYDSVTGGISGPDSNGLYPTKDYPATKLKYHTSSTSDPNNVLPDIETINIVGATGPRGGPPGPAGPGYDDIERTEVVQGGDLDPRLDLTFKANSLLNSDVTIQDVRGATGPKPSEEDVLDIINNIDLDINIPEYPQNPDGTLKGPYVYADKGAQTAAGLTQQNIFGEKVIKNRLQFFPEDETKTMIDFPEDVSMYTTHEITSSGKDMRQLNMYSRSPGADKTRGLYLGFATVGPGQNPGSANIGIRVPDPQSAIDMKGALRIATGNIVLHNGPGGSGGLGDKHTQIIYRNGAHPTIQWSGTSSNIFYFRHEQLSGDRCAVRFKSRVEVDRLAIGEDMGMENAFLVKGHVFKQANGSHNVRWDNGTNNMCRTNSIRLSTPSSSSSSHTFSTNLDGSIALNIVKQLEPKLIYDEELKENYVSLCSDDLGSDTFSVMKDGQGGDGVSSLTSAETMISLLIKSIQRLEDRITALENA